MTSTSERVSVEETEAERPVPSPLAGADTATGVPAGASRTGALAVGALAVGALALGAVAIGALAVGRLAIGQARIRKLVIDELQVGRITRLRSRR